MGSSRGLVLFDFDGTIADSMRTALEVYNEVAPGLRVPRISADDARLRHMNPRDALRESRIPLWKVPFLMAAIRFRLRDRMESIPIFPEVERAIDELVRAGFRCAIVSSNSRSNIERFLAKNGLTRLEILGTGAGLFGKPRALRKALGRANVRAASAVYVGDEIRDVVAAKELGMKSVAVTWGYAGRDALVAAGPDLVVDRPEDLARLVIG